MIMNTWVLELSFSRLEQNTYFFTLSLHTSYFWHFAVYLHTWTLIGKTHQMTLYRDAQWLGKCVTIVEDMGEVVDKVQMMAQLSIFPIGY